MPWKGAREAARVALERPAEGFEGFEGFEGGQTAVLNALKNRWLGPVAARQQGSKQASKARQGKARQGKARQSKAKQASKPAGFRRRFRRRFREALVQVPEKVPKVPGLLWCRARSGSGEGSREGV